MTGGRAVLLVLVAAIMASSCKKAPEDPLLAAHVAADVLRWAPPPRELRWERKTVVGPIGLPLTPVRQVWSRAGVEKDGVLYDVLTGDDTEGASRVVQRYRYGPDGLAIVAEGRMTADGPAWEPWVPPLMLLRRDAASGQAWEAEHRHGDAVVPRSCEVLVSDLCTEGLVVVCDRTEPQHRLITRDHFCPGGWGGYESLLVRADQPDVRTWTEGLRRVD